MPIVRIYICYINAWRERENVYLGIIWNLLLRLQTFVLFLLRKDEGFYLWPHRNKKKSEEKKKKKRTIRSYKFNVVYFYKEIIDQSHNKRKKKKKRWR